MRYLIATLLITTACVISYGSSNEKQIPTIETRKIVVKEIKEADFVDLREAQKEFPTGVEKAVDHVINNLNNVDGWSYSGYAKLSLDSEFRMQRWKFGIINAETYDLDTQLYYRKNNLFTEYEHEPKSLLFGIAFNKEF